MNASGIRTLVVTKSLQHHEVRRKYQCLVLFLIKNNHFKSLVTVFPFLLRSIAGKYSIKGIS